MAGCVLTEDPAPRPLFPSAPQVSMLVMPLGERVRDQAAIDLFLSNLNSLKGAWSYTWHTYPTPQAEIFLFSSNEMICRVDIGPNWLGSTCGHSVKGWPPYTHLTREEATAFRELVGGSWEVR